MALYDWSVPVSSLLNQMQRYGFAITSVHNGEQTIKLDQNQSAMAIRRAATSEVVSVDIATVNMELDGKPASLEIVLGNDPDELLSDFYTPFPSLEDLIDMANDQFMIHWEGKKCPTIKGS